MDYLYDGSFQGLLTCIYHHYYTEKATGIFTKDTYQMNLLGGYMEVATEPDKADRVYAAMEEKISRYAVRCMYKTFLSSVPHKEMKILRFAVKGFREGPKVTMMHGEDVVIDILSTVQKIGTEVEKMCQFVRFQEMEGGVLYGRIEPDHDVTELLWHHFTDRFRNEPFIIHDVGRNKALIAYRGEWMISDFTEDDLPACSGAEKDYQSLWQSYFDHIAIQERVNPRCQRNFVPMRYRKHLVEFQPRTANGDDDRQEGKRWMND